ncbi:Zinc/iron permease [Schizophyllum commune]
MFISSEAIVNATSAVVRASLHRRADEEEEEVNCGEGGGDDAYLGLRIASVFIILVGSTFGALFPVLAKRAKWLTIPKSVFDFAKYFGSGVIIATAFIHLLDPALEALESPCLSPSWGEYPYALALCMASIFGIFILELLAFRWGTARLAQIGMTHDAHGHDVGGSVAAHGPEGANTEMGSLEKQPLDEVEKDELITDTVAAQIIGVGILEFGVVLHSILIGLTLAVDEDFKTLFVVIVFHQMFEGLGVGSRLAYLRLPSKYTWVPIAAALLYGITTPVGIAAGLGVRTTYNPGSTTASTVSGVMDSISAGILIYTGLVELLAHEFLFNREMQNASNGKLAYAIICMVLGWGLMALLGKWA